MPAPATQPFTALALSGGIALGAYEAGACAALQDAGQEPRWIAGASVGAITAALIAGNPPERRAARLKEFWQAATHEPLPLAPLWFGAPFTGPWREAEAMAAALQSHLFGCPSIFRPRLGLPGAGVRDVPALYDLSPLRAQLEQLVDFGRLNSGTIRVSITATDIESGDRVVFDTARGQRIGPEHLLASGALLPLFGPVEIEGRLLGDGGLASNLPLDLILDDLPPEEVLCLAVELFARRGSRPHTLAAAASRAGDIAFGNQTRRMVEGRQREHRLRALLAHLPEHLADDPALANLRQEARTQRTAVICLSYRAALDEAGLGKAFDFSGKTLTQRWQRGGADMRIALEQARHLPTGAGLVVHEIDTPAEGAE
ncbi:patatin-like phospholipase family protein [Pseudoroseomonas globiformis]|uniref:Patatin-like phospholipase family protein n=1 Tax=Teichococcus globiformis TaxID=2307229 RepID=A0ABV7G362_9PROT